jgi:hypothetical protein
MPEIVKVDKFCMGVSTTTDVKIFQAARAAFAQLKCAITNQISDQGLNLCG